MSKGVEGLQELRRVIRAAGLRVTASRLAVLGCLARARKPLSHAEVFERLSAERLDRVTVYRNLIDMSDAGLLNRADLGDHVWRFELGSEVGDRAPSDHAHFVCVECGRVQCLDEGSVRVRGAQQAPQAVRARQVEVQLRGVCDGCA